MDKIGKIYIIENDMNNKVYIGQTVQQLSDRFKLHINEGIVQRNKTKLYRAMGEIGVEHFTIRELTRCEIDNLSRLEIEYIKKYDSYHNGYNSTPGGDSGKSVFMGLDIDTFVEMYQNMVPAVEMATYFKCSVKTIHKVRDELGLEASHGAYGNNAHEGGKSGHKREIVKYDKYFNALKLYDSIKQAISENNGNDYWYYYIRESCLRGNIAYGYRWQYLDDLRCSIGGQEVYLNTIFDKQQFINGNTNVERTPAGTLKIEGIIYADYVGETARENCTKCGTRLNKENICDQCRITEAKQNRELLNNDRVKQITILLGRGLNLARIGEKLGLTPNGVKKICIKNGIDYSTNVPKRSSSNIHIVNPNNNAEGIINRDELYQHLVNLGICNKSSKYNFFASVVEAQKQGKLIYGYKMGFTDRTDLHIDTDLFTTEQKQPEIITYLSDSGQLYHFNTWEDVRDFLVNNNLTIETNQYKLKSSIKQSIKIRSGRRFSGTWSVE